MSIATLSAIIYDFNPDTQMLTPKLEMIPRKPKGFLDKLLPTTDKVIDALEKALTPETVVYLGTGATTLAEKAFEYLKKERPNLSDYQWDRIGRKINQSFQIAKELNITRESISRAEEIKNTVGMDFEFIETDRQSGKI